MGHFGKGEDDRMSMTNNDTVLERSYRQRKRAAVVNKPFQRFVSHLTKHCGTFKIKRRARSGWVSQAT